MAGDPHIRVGPAGWSYDDWKGIVYPAGMKRHALAWLCEAFDTVEINVSFYRPVPARYAESWLGHVAPNPNFRFLAKLWNRFTHEPGGFSEADVRTYRDGVAPLLEAGKLGSVLVQFPWSFRRTPGNRLTLARILDAFPDLPLTVEFRHASWDRDEVYEGLRARGAAFCNIDQPALRDNLGPTARVTAPVAYVRLHGRNAEHWFRDDSPGFERYNYLYAADELAPWLERIRELRRQAETVYVVTNNHYRGQAVANGLEIEHAFGRPVEAIPPGLAETYPQLGALQAQP